MKININGACKCSPCPTESLDLPFLWTQIQQVRVRAWWRPGLHQEWSLFLRARRSSPLAHTVFSRLHPVAPPAPWEQDPPPRSKTNKRYRWEETIYMQFAWLHSPNVHDKTAFGRVTPTTAKCKWTLISITGISIYHIIINVIIIILSSMIHLLPKSLKESWLLVAAVY